MQIGEPQLPAGFGLRAQQSIELLADLPPLACGLRELAFDVLQGLDDCLEERGEQYYRRGPSRAGRTRATCFVRRASRLVSHSPRRARGRRRGRRRLPTDRTAGARLCHPSAHPRHDLAVGTAKPRRQRFGGGGRLGGLLQLAHASYAREDMNMKTGGNTPPSPPTPPFASVSRAPTAGVLHPAGLPSACALQRSC